jgi:predicted lactoylglutathione lyase
METIKRIFHPPKKPTNMNTKVFINLPVKDLEASRAFYAALGYTINEQFSNEQAACVVISEEIYVMLLTHPFFTGFTSKEIADSTRTTEVLNCLSADSREAVDALVSKARNAGGAVPRESQDMGFMYSHGFEDVDGHIWEVCYMDMEAVANGAMEHQASAN